jgi:3-hydroxybutyryl-CoA dehydrogenase
MNHSSLPRNTIQNVAIIGAGQMGQGIAQIFATNGFHVTLIDTNQECILKALKKIEQSLQKLYKKGFISCLDVFDNIVTTNHLKDIIHTNFIIEAIPENFSYKVNLYKEIENIMKEQEFLLCSNTSSFSITKLQENLISPSRFLGFHFMNPPVLMPLVEIIPGQKTHEDALLILKNILISLKKEGVICKDTPGFILNRLLIPMINEACLMVDENIATNADIDKTLTLGANFPMGALTLADYIGIDTVLSVMKNLKKDLRPGFKLQNV